MERKAGFRAGSHCCWARPSRERQPVGHPGLCGAGTLWTTGQTQEMTGLSSWWTERLVETPGIFFGCRSLPIVNWNSLSLCKEFKDVQKNKKIIRKMIIVEIKRKIKINSRTCPLIHFGIHTCPQFAIVNQQVFFSFH